MLFGYVTFIKKSGTDGSKFPIMEKCISIGRSENCLIRIQNPKVALEHCRLIIDSDGQAKLKNLSNITILNGRPLNEDEVTLCHGDIFKLGERMARWEYLPWSKYYNKLLSPAGRLVAVVMPQQRFMSDLILGTSQGHATLRGTPGGGKRKFSEKSVSEQESARKKAKISSVRRSTHSKSVGILIPDRRSLQTSKTSNSKVTQRRKSSSAVLNSKHEISVLQTSENFGNSTLSSWKVNSPRNKKSVRKSTPIKKPILHKSVEKSKSVWKSSKPPNLKTTIELLKKEKKEATLTKFSPSARKSSLKLSLPVISSKGKKYVFTPKHLVKSERKLRFSSNKNYFLESSSGPGLTEGSKNRKNKLSHLNELLNDNLKVNSQSDSVGKRNSKKNVASPVKDRTLKPNAEKKSSEKSVKTPNKASSRKSVNKKAILSKKKSSVKKNARSSSIISSTLQKASVEKGNVSSVNKAGSATEILPKPSDKSGRQLPTKSVRRKLNLSLSDPERAAKKLKTSSPRKLDKNKKAALLVLGKANSKQSISKYAKVMLKRKIVLKAIKQSTTIPKLKEKKMKKPITKRKLQKSCKGTVDKIKKIKEKSYVEKKRTTRLSNKTVEVSGSEGASRLKKNEINIHTEEGSIKNKKSLDKNVSNRFHSGSQNLISSSSKIVNNDSSLKSPKKQNREIQLSGISPSKVSVEKSTPEDRNSLEHTKSFGFNSNRRCSKRLSYKNDSGRPDFMELSPTALGLIPKNTEVLKISKEQKNKLSLETPKVARSPGITKSSTSKLKSGSCKSVRFLPTEGSISSPFSVSSTIDNSDFESPQMSSTTMDVFVSPLSDRSNESSKIFINETARALDFGSKECSNKQSPMIRRRMKLLQRTVPSRKFCNPKSLKSSLKSNSFQSSENSDSFNGSQTSDVIENTGVSQSPAGLRISRSFQITYKTPGSSPSVKYLKNERSSTDYKKHNNFNSSISQTYGSPKTRGGVTIGDISKSSFSAKLVKSPSSTRSPKNLINPSTIQIINDIGSPKTPQSTCALKNLKTTQSSTILRRSKNFEVIESLKSPKTSENSVPSRSLKTPQIIEVVRSSISMRSGSIKNSPKTPESNKPVRTINSKSPKIQSVDSPKKTIILGNQKTLQFKNTPETGSTLRNSKISQSPIVIQEKIVSKIHQSRSPIVIQEKTASKTRQFQSPIVIQEKIVSKIRQSRSPIMIKENNVSKTRQSQSPIVIQEKTASKARQSRSPIVIQEKTASKARQSRSPIVIQEQNVSKTRQSQTSKVIQEKNVSKARQSQSPIVIQEKTASKARQSRSPIVIQEKTASKIRQSQSPIVIQEQNVSKTRQSQSSNVIPEKNVSKARQSKSPKTLQENKTPRASRSPKTFEKLLNSDIIINPTSSNLDNTRAKKSLKISKPQKSPKNDLSDVTGVKRLFSIPKPQKGPKNDLSDVTGVKKLFSIPKPQKSPKNDFSDVTGIKKLFSIPKPQKSPKNDFSDVTGVKKLFSIPKPQKSPKNDFSDVTGVKKLFNIPKPQKSPKNDLSDVIGVRRILTTPRCGRSNKNDLMDISGVDQLFKSPSTSKIFKNGVENDEQFLQTSERNWTSSRDTAGVKQLLVSKSYESVCKSSESVSRNSGLNDYRNIRGRRTIYSTSRSSRNYLSDLRGVRELFSRHKESNDLNVSLTGVAELFDFPTPKESFVRKQNVSRSSKKSTAEPNMKISTIRVIRKRVKNINPISENTEKHDSKQTEEQAQSRKCRSKSATNVMDIAKRSLRSKRDRSSPNIVREVKKLKSDEKSLKGKETTNKKKVTKTESTKLTRKTSKAKVTFATSNIATVKSRKRKITSEELLPSPPKLRKRQVEPIASFAKAIGKETPKKGVSKSKSKLSMEFSNGRNNVSGGQSEPSPKVQIKTTKKAIKAKSKSSKVQNPRSQNSSKKTDRQSMEKASPRVTRSVKKTNTSLQSKNKRTNTLSKKIDKKEVKSVTSREKLSPAVRRSTRRK